MENEIYYVKVRGKANIPSKLIIGHNYKLTADCSITEEKKTDNENGEFSCTATAEIITAEIQKDNGVTIKAKDSRSNSQLIRGRFFGVWKNRLPDQDFDTFYKKATHWILDHADLIADEILK